MHNASNKSKPWSIPSKTLNSQWLYTTNILSVSWFAARNARISLMEVKEWMFRHYSHPQCVQIANLFHWVKALKNKMKQSQPIVSIVMQFFQDLRLLLLWISMVCICVVHVILDTKMWRQISKKLRRSRLSKRKRRLTFQWRRFHLKK